MSEDSSLKQLVADEVSEQLEVTDLIDGGSLEDGIDAGEIGAAVGRQFGEQVGRNVGASVGGEIHEVLSSAVQERGEGGEEDTEAEAEADETETETEATAEADEDGRIPTQLLSELAAAIRRGVATALEGSDARESAESVAQNVADGTSLEGVVDEATGGEDAEADEADTDDGGAEDEEADEAEDQQETDESGLEQSAEDLENLRRETLVDFLGVMSYEDLQSVAKEVGVKANLSREEMTDEIVDTVTDDDGGTADDGADGNGDEADEGDGDGADSEDAEDDDATEDDTGNESE
ncbi:hypothetical protein C482_14489 [Natrialba chahannaoensis JCM 10990]|uniref:Uncharacterized protein n=1 Tax=Natrialba chahannaoensis JCM 10990 TaxID=1227492 RepID=M0AGI8_9EURY|nr:hypothetical protein [Natrialba chahannaoensis]ELY96987.1 hypothetical protein C482_14489 [Natrialba chahannaoensis JCM 10990]